MNLKGTAPDENGKPRRRTSTSVCPGNSSLELLAYELDGSSNNNALDHDKPAFVHKPSQQRWLASLTALALISVFSFALYVSIGRWEGGRLDLTASLPDPFDKPQGIPALGITLHPEEHRSREATIITLYWNITSDYRVPDGVRKKVYLINGEFPGPTIEARSGDNLIVHIENSLESPNDGVSIHWHGLFMEGYNSMDGTVGFTQCAIPPGRNFTYEFSISDDQHGTFWYHAHSQQQQADGLFGGLIIHRPDDTGLNEGEQHGYQQEVLLLVGDWYHQSVDEIPALYANGEPFEYEPAPDSLLVNGRGVFNCSTAVPERPTECTRTRIDDLPSVFGYNLAPTRLRLINTGSIAGLAVGISHAKITTLQLDGGFKVMGTPVDWIGTLHPGERADLLVKWGSDVLWAGSDLKITMDSENFKYQKSALTTNQTFPIFPPFAAPSPAPIPPLTLPPPALATAKPKPQYFDLDSATPISTDAVKIPVLVDQIILLYTKTRKLSESSSHPVGFINRTSWAPQSPPLIDLPRPQWDEHQFISHISPPARHFTRDAGGSSLIKAALWVDLIINNLDDASHSFHIHGHNFYVVARHRSTYGWGSYNPWSHELGNVAPVYNLERPLRKDTVSVPRRGFVVLRFQADNPGLWMVHCHSLVHLGNGMAMGLEIGDVGSARNKERSEANEEARALCF